MSEQVFWPFSFDICPPACGRQCLALSIIFRRWKASLKPTTVVLLVVVLVVVLVVLVK